MTSETDEQFLNNMEQYVIDSLVFKRFHRERLFALARRGAAKGECGCAPGDCAADEVGGPCSRLPPPPAGEPRDE